MFEQALAEDPDNAIALIGMGNWHFDDGNIPEARSMAERVKESDFEQLSDKSQAEKSLAELCAKLQLWDYLQACNTAQNNAAQNDAAQNDAAQNDAAQNDALTARMQEGCRFALEGGCQEALSRFLSIVQEDRGFMDDVGRKAMVAVFDLLPVGSELTYDYRNKLSLLLFS